MKKLYLMIGVMSIFTLLQSQTRVTFTENFDGTTQSFSMHPTTAWMLDTQLSVNGKASWGFIPDTEGDSAVLLSPLYDLQPYGYAYLRFSHICKIADFDQVTVEYKEDYVGARWRKLPANTYKGSSITYRKTQQFHDKSYDAWMNNDFYAEPNNSWWRTESFDISQEVSFARVQFRFKIVKGSKTGSQFTWGWLIDNFELIASTSEINPPAVELLKPIIAGKVLGAGPYQIIAKAAPRTLIPLQSPILRYTYKIPDQADMKDSVVMTLIEGDSTWMGSIPQFPIGTQVDYMVYVTDTVGNDAMVNSSYFIDRKWGFDSNSVAINAIDTPLRGAYAGVQTPVVVNIENRGLMQLTSAIIYWTLNGVSQPITYWTGTLDEGFSEQVRLGTFYPQFGKYDTITAWISEPNGMRNPSYDTIVSKVTYGCDVILSGDYTVGSSGDFPSVNDALEVLNLCGTNGNVTLKLQNGTYVQSIDLINLNEYTGAYDILTITSLSGNAEDVILKNDPNRSSVIDIARSHNVVIQHVSIDATETFQGIAFLDTAYNIEINNCHILLDSTGKTTTYGIYKNLNTGLFDRIRILHNYINGGSYGMYINGPDNYNYNTNLYIENNIIKNALTAAVYLRYTQFNSISENHFFSRLNYAGSTFTAIQAQYTHGKYICKNKIRSYRVLDNSTGMNFMYLNYLDTVNIALIANNEIIVHSNSASGGSGFSDSKNAGGPVITLSYASADVIHNSILKTGMNDVAAINISYPTYLNLQNNNIVTQQGYPVQCANTNFGLNCFMDYNNYYSALGNYVGYFGAAILDMNTWVSTTGQDSNSISMLPHYIDTSKHLQMTNYVNFESPISPLVPIDILDSLRIGITAMGCYTPSRLNFDIIALGADNWVISKPTNQTTNVDAIFMNIGSYDTLYNVTLNWSVNGVVQSPVSWSGALLPYTDTIAHLGSFQPQSKFNTIKIWISQPNGTAFDMNPGNDTVTLSVYGCDMPLHGTFTIGGTGADFASLSEAIQVATFCSIDGPVTFVIQDGEYYDLTMGGIIPGSDSINTITFKAVNRENVILKGMTNVITLTNTSHLIFDNLTIDAYDIMYGVILYGSCSDIEIRNCNIILDTATSLQQSGIYFNNTANLNSGIRVIHNTINGGYYGIYFNGGSTTLGHSTAYVIDSNTLTNQYFYAIYTSFVDFESVSYNNISARTLNENTSWYGIRLYYSFTPKVIGNKVHSFSNQITNPYGMYLQNMNDVVQSLVANNEVIITTGGAYYGIYCSNSNIDFYHNSVLMLGKGAGRAFNLTNSANNYTIKNNNFITLADALSFPIYLASVSNIGTSWIINHNNYYSNGSYVGYAGANIASLAAWKSAVSTDLNSVNIMPAFVNFYDNLSMYKNTLITCPAVADVSVDILNKTRKATTYMGAYEESVFSYNTALVSFVQPSQNIVSPNDSIHVDVVLRNTSDSVLNSVSIHWSVNGIAQPALAWTGNLLPQASDTVSLGSFYAAIYENTILAYTSLPNGHADEAPSNDSVRYLLYGCAGPLAGNYTVGNTGADFPSISSALNTLYQCGINNVVTLDIAPGVYEDLNLYGPIPGANSNNIVILRSASGHAADVIIGDRADYGDALTLENTSYLKFVNLTIGSTNQIMCGVKVKGTLTDVVFDSCQIKALLGTTRNTSASFYRENASNALITGLELRNCLLEGGYYNLYMQNAGASTSNYGNMKILSCHFKDAYNTGLHSMSSGYIIYTIKDNYFNNYSGTTSYVGMRFGQAVANANIDTCSGNKMYLNASSGNTCINIGQNINYNGPLAAVYAFIGNNEFIIEGGTSNYGFSYSNQSYINFIGNSIYINGSGGNAYGFYMSNTATGYPIFVKYNNFYIKNPGGNAYSVSHSANNWSTDIIQLDYNNYYTEGPYIVSTYTSLKTWQDDIAQDYHSINEKVNFTHFPQNLHTDGKKAILPSSADLMYDMDYKRRLSYTNAGCYHDFVPHSYDAKVEKVVSPQNGMTTGISTDVSIQIANVGLELDSCEIHWKVNGILQPVYRWSSTPGLAFGEISPSIIIGSFIPIGGENILEIWTARPNAQWDGNPFNDTLVLSVTSCDSALHGRYTVGTPSSDFKNMQQVVDKLSNCSISGPVVFELAAGAYTEIVFRNAIQGASAQNTITFTSARGRASDVMIGTTTEVAVNLRNVGHIHFKNVSIGTTQSQTSYGVKLEGDCENISFYACNIYANASSTSNTSAAIYYSGTNNSPLYLKNISIVKNNIQGGYYNLYLNYAGGSKNNMPASAANRTSVTIDSNYFTDAYTYGISSSYFCYAPSISYNSIIPRTSSTTFYGITLSNYCTVDKIVNNRLNLINNGTTYGMNLSYLNHDTTYGADEPCLIANNEIISNNGTTVYGINRTYGRMYVINNSIYVCGTTTTRALVMGTASTATTNYFYAYNNIVIANGTGSTNQAIYASNANYIRRTYQVFFDYNAYYSTLDMAYAGSALPNLSDWQSTYQQDSNAIYIMPAFVDVTKNLHLADFNPALICLKNDLVDYDINNYQRTTLTIRGAYSTPLYEGFDLALEAFVEPIVGAVECFPDYTPVKISLYNQGTYLADFAQDSVVLHFSCVSDSVNVQNTVVINSDSLLAMNKEVYEVFPMLDIIYPGTYQLKVWMECDRDEQAFNDTLILDYYVEKSILPYDNDFSWTGAGVAVNQVHGTIEWHISDQLPLPAVFGDKSLHFNSVQGKGSISQALFPSVHLQGTYHPRLQFWYAHDNANPTLRDHMDIKISLDGGATFTLLKTIFRYNQAYNTPTWVPYLIDLSNYTQGSCIILSFVAYSYGGGDQLIDRINIVAAQDMKLSLISPDFSEFTACDLSNKAFSVIIENMTNQPIPFHSGDSITLDITGINPQTFTYPLSGKLEGMAIDTIEITQMADFSVSGNYNILAYTNDIDSIQTNDTDRVSYSFLADINLHEIVPIGYKNVGDTVYPTVKIINTGSIAVYSPFDIRMILNGKDTIVEPITDMMEVGDTITHLFTNYFIVPEISSVQPFYLLDILSALPCDGLASNNLKKYIGNVNFKDLNIYEINYPTANTYLKKNEEVYVEAYIYNRGTYDSEGVVVYVEVDSGGVLITSFSDTTEAIAAEATILHTFSTPYHVPEFNADSMMYTVRVFLQASDEDVDISNDTLSVETYALNDVSIDAFDRVNWTMEQNIPNPASAATRIAYSIPQEGIIHFTITTIAGQVLHSQDIHSSAGAHSMEFDTQHLAGGIYYYSMEYQGQRIVKKMTVQK